MYKNCLISIIVPVYNKEKYLEECILSLTGQTYRNKEIILVDDGSTDSSGTICDSYKDRFDFIKVIHKHNGGPSSAWKAGFDVSEGDYIMFVDSDDHVDEKMLEEMSIFLTGTKGEVVLSDYAVTKEDGSEYCVYQDLPAGEYLKADINDKIRPNILGNERRVISFSRCMKLIERSMIAENKEYCDDRVLMGDDSTIILPILLDASRIVMMDRKVFYHYRYLDDSIVHRYDDNAFNNNKLHYGALKRIIEDKITDKEIRNRMIEALNREEIMLLLLLVKNEVRGNPGNSLGNLKQIRKDPFVSNIVDGTDVMISDKANKLLYGVLKSPNAFSVLALRFAFSVYYRRVI